MAAPRQDLSMDEPRWAGHSCPQCTAEDGSRSWKQWVWGSTCGSHQRGGPCSPTWNKSCYRLTTIHATCLWQRKQLEGKGGGGCDGGASPCVFSILGFWTIIRSKCIQGFLDQQKTKRNPLPLALSAPPRATWHFSVHHCLLPDIVQVCTISLSEN